MHPEIRKCLTLLPAAGLLLATSAVAQDPVQVFILAGQSNMQGQGWYDDNTPDNGVDEDGTLRKLIESDPATYGHLLDGSGNWITRNDAFVYTTDGGISGGLSVGYGVNTSRIGPELGFGTVVGDAYGQDVLLIKTNWGGKSLKTDFRPPTAVQNRGGEVGFYYNQMLSEVDSVLSNIGTYVPSYTGQGYELKGFGWHQGWNDRVDSDAVIEYEQNLVDFINDVRFDLGAAELPFVVANTGIGGDDETSERALNLMQAQLNVGDAALYPAFAGNVVSVETRGFWRDASISPITSGNQGFHWNQNGETMYLIGDAMGQAMAGMSAYVPFKQSYLEVNKQTGEIKIVNPGDNILPFELEAYQIHSSSGALNASAWTSIAGNYDAAGDGSVDDGNWTVDLAGLNALGESAESGGADGSLGIGTEISLGQGAWIQNLNLDLNATFTDTDGTIKKLYIVYTGDDNILADLDFDGAIGISDWGIFINHAQADMTGLTAPQAYQAGDLDGDGDNDLFDFAIFRAAYEDLNPAPGSFEAMLAEYQASVPEPSSLALLLGSGLWCLRRNRKPLSGRCVVQLKVKS